MQVCGPGEWCHVAGLFDGVRVKIYINGALDGELAYSGTPPTTGHTLRIGQRYSGDFTFKGLIDEVSIYNRALTDEEIQAIFAAGSAGKCRPE